MRTGQEIEEGNTSDDVKRINPFLPITVEYLSFLSQAFSDRRLDNLNSHKFLKNIGQETWKINRGEIVQ
jgi:hypothetical protein